MNASRVALALVGLLLVGLWFAGGGAAPLPSSAAASELRVSQPVSHDNLTIFFVHGRDAVPDAKVATLQEALAAGWAVVHETGTVNTLEVENRSADTELFIQEGDIIKGGKQDRLIAIDMLLPPNSGRVAFPAHCVEQGRWTGRGQEPATQFYASTKFAIGNDLKLANATYQQGEVWKNVALNQDKLSENVGQRINAAESESSLQLALENPAVQARVGEYERALSSAHTKRKNVVGVVFIINGKLTGAEVYGSNALFQKAWPKLLNSAATEALAEKKSNTLASAPSAREVERFLASGGEPLSTAGGPEGPATPALHFNDQGSVRSHALPQGLVLDAEEAAPQLNVNGRSGSTRTRLSQQGGGQLNSAQNPQQVFRNLARREDLVLPQNAVQYGGQPMQNEARTGTPGNRLNINRVGNAAGLVTESRDPARGNAVVHKSYIKR